jgi:hypothetical protein
MSAWEAGTASMPEASLVASSVVLAIDAHVNRCCPRALEVLDRSVHLGRGAASGRMHFRMRVLPPVIMSWTVCLSLLMTPVGLAPPASKSGTVLYQTARTVYLLNCRRIAVCQHEASLVDPRCLLQVTMQAGVRCSAG